MFTVNSVQYILEDGKAILCTYLGSDKNYSIPNQINIASNLYDVTKIGQTSFYRNEVTDVIIGANVEIIEYQAFARSKIKSIIFESNSKIKFIRNEILSYTPFYNAQENWAVGVLYVSNCLISADNTLTDCIVKNGTKLIATNAFVNCRSLSTIILPDSLEYINNGAFSGYYIESIIIPKSVKEIGARVFLVRNIYMEHSSSNEIILGEEWSGTGNVEWDYQS